MNNRILLITCIMLCHALGIQAQDMIRTKSEATIKPNYKFSDEWQYLTTDIYLFNEDRFNNLINSLDRKPSKSLFGKVQEERVEMLTILAKVKDVENFNNSEVVYPLFNYKVDYSKDQEYKTRSFAGDEAIRMFDNLPLATTENFINAVIEGTVVTNTQGNMVMNLIAQQLQNISKFTDPSTVVLTIVGELGKYLESSSRKKQYKFSSTIRLYDDAKFSKRLHSINVFSLRPSKDLHKENFDAAKLQAYVSLLTFDDQNPMDYDQLKTLLPYEDYPFFVVVNYKSKYNPPAINEDRIDYEFIENYKHRVREDCDQGLNNAVVCKQEDRLIEFLYDFAKFKVLKQQYDLNFENNLTDKLDKNLFMLLKAYYGLHLEVRERKQEFANVPAFNNDFLPRYEKLMQTTERYLSESSHLNKVRLAVNAIVDLQTKKQSEVSVEEAEKYAVLLYAITLPEDEHQTEAYGQIEKWRDILDKNIYEHKYMTMVDKLSTMEANDRTFEEYEQIKNDITGTACVICRREMNDASSMFLQRYEDYKFKQILKEAIQKQNVAKDELTSYLRIKYCVNQNYNATDSTTNREDYEFIYNDMTHAFELMEKLKQLVGKDISLISKEELLSYDKALENLSSQVEINLKENCKRLPEFCECEN